MDVIAVIKEKLSKLNPNTLEITDESHLHIGHPGNTGGGHYALYIVSSAFNKLQQIERHRLIYKLHNEELKTQIHALRINAKTPNEIKLWK